MKRKEMLNSIRETLKKVFSSTGFKFSDYKLDDGRTITSDADVLEVGTEIYVLDENGVETPLDNGDYVLTDGRSISISDNVITEIAGEDDATEDQSPVSDASLSNQKMNDALPEKPSDESGLAQRVSDIENVLDEILQLVKSMGEHTSQTSEQMMSKLKEFGATPGSTPIKTKKVDNKPYNKADAAKMAEFSEIEEIRNILKFKRSKSNNN